jgi:hypothetical protein
MARDRQQGSVGTLSDDDDVVDSFLASTEGYATLCEQIASAVDTIL